MSEKPFTILIVDDEEVIRDLLSSFFKRKGYQALTASTADEAFKHAQKQAIDIALLDIQMPDINGHQVCQRLRGMSSESRPLGIIMITGYGSRNNKELAIQCGADDLIEKPLDLEELLYRMKSWEEVQGMEGQLERVASYAFKVKKYHKGQNSE